MNPLQILTASDSASLGFSLHGGQVCSWVPAGESGNRLFLSERADYQGSIRGGVPVIFPQFNARGPLPRHGLVRTAPWREVFRGPGELLLEIDEALATHPLWPQPYRLQTRIHFGGNRLSIALELHNSGEKPLSFTGALHSYFAVRALSEARLDGLGGASFLDALHGETEAVQLEGELALGEALDRIYPAAPRVLELREPGRRLRIESRGFADAVIWNPGAAAAELPDLAPGDEQRFVCVEAATLLHPMTLRPDGRWTGTQILTALP